MRDNIKYIIYLNILNALDQFELINIISIYVLYIINISLTNIGLYIIISFIIIIILPYTFDNNNYLMLNNYLIILSSIKETIYNILISQISNLKECQKYFPLIYSLFMFILINNLLGMLPYNFSTTAHFILTFFLSFNIVIGCTIIGLIKYKLKFFAFFVPSGCPLILIPLLVFIELISYISRNISLGLRLSANILSGHMLLHILSDFTYKILNKGKIYLIIGILPIIFIIAFTNLELAITFIQAQVFVVLTSSYLKDAIFLH
jgi:F-type H+-transporting ATPase subunit a